MGVYAAALTPMHEDLRCNCEALVDHCKALLTKGCKGIVLFGTTGEGSSFSLVERGDALIKSIELGLDPKKIILGISSAAISDVVKLASLAIDHKCKAVLLSPPFFYKNVEEGGVVNFYRKVIFSVNHPDLRIILYHIPQYSGVPITLPIIEALKKEFPKQIIGIKESEGNLDFTKKILSSFKDFLVFVGSELQISEAVQLGAIGAISGVVNAYPKLILSLYEFGLDQQKPNKNLLAKNIIQSLKNYPIFPAIKKVVGMQKGADWHLLRPPLLSLNENQSKMLIESLRILEARFD